MKTIKTILYAVAVVLATISCQKSIEPANPAENGKETIDICVSGLLDSYTQQDAVKSSPVNNVRVAWAAGDVVYVFYGGGVYLGKLTVALDKKADGKTDEDRYAKLSGTIKRPATRPCVLTLVHSSLMTEPKELWVPQLSIDMSSQKTSTVPFVAYATMDYTGTAISNVVVPFQLATSVIKVNCTGLKANTAISFAKLSNVNTVCKLTLSETGAPSVSGAVNGTIAKRGDPYFAAEKVNSNGETVFQIAVPKLETASEARVLIVAQGSEGVRDKKFTTNSLAVATSVNTVCQLVRLPDGALLSEFTVKAATGAEPAKKVYFSRGNLVASVKAGSPEAWWFAAKQYDCPGENGINQYPDTSTGDIDFFGWSTSDNGGISTTDNYGINSSPYDEDYSGDFYDWGKAYCESNCIEEGTWRTLTKDEWSYLFNNHSCKWVTVNNVNGYVIAPDDFKGKLADSYNDDDALAEYGLVFFPAAGYHVGILERWYFGVCGAYWSSTASGSENAEYLLFMDNGVGPTYTFRCHRNNVRLITE